MFVAASAPKSLKTLESNIERLPALLISGDLALAQQAAVAEWNWQSRPPNCFMTAEGEVVHAVEDRSLSASINWPRGTRVYLGPGWYEREDSRALNSLLHCGHLVEVDPPNSGGR